MHERDDRTLTPRWQRWSSGVIVDRLTPADVLAAARSLLAKGSLAALEVDYQLELFHRWYRVQPIGTGGSQPARSTDELLSRLDESNSCLFRMFPSTRTLIIEDEFAVRSDPILSTCAFLDDRVVRWRRVAPGPVAAAEFLRPGRHGVGLVGYLSTLDPHDIGLRPGENLSSESVGRLVNSTIAVIFPLSDDDVHVVACRVDPCFD